MYLNQTIFNCHNKNTANKVDVLVPSVLFVNCQENISYFHTDNFIQMLMIKYFSCDKIETKRMPLVTHLVITFA